MGLDLVLILVHTSRFAPLRVFITRLIGLIGLTAQVPFLLQINPRKEAVAAAVAAVLAVGAV